MGRVVTLDEFVVLSFAILVVLMIWYGIEWIIQRSRNRKN